MFAQRRVTGAAYGLIVLHVAVLSYFSTHSFGPVVSDCLQLILGLLLVFAISGAAQRSDAGGRYFWRLNSVAFSLWIVAQGLSLYSDFFGQSEIRAWSANLLFSFWFMPLGLALFLDSDYQTKIFDWLLVLDFVQAGLFCVTAYFFFFYIPSVADPNFELSHSVWAPYFGIYAILVIAFFVRAAVARSPVLRELFCTTGLFLLMSVLADAAYYYGPGRLLSTGAWFDVVWSLLLLLRLLTADRWNLAQAPRPEMPAVQERGVIITQVFPLLYPAFILAMSAYVRAEWLRMAWVAVFLSFACFSARLLLTQNRLLQAQECLRKEATHDGLTGAWNRVAILDILERELLRAQREANSVGVIMIDADRFKSVNDTFGHVVGDNVLRKIHSCIAEILRPYDSLGRYGGEEFLIVVPGCTLTETKELAERIRARIFDCKIPVNDFNVPLTLSVGVTVGSDGGDLEALLQAADTAMYAAKRQGGNRVKEHSTTPHAPLAHNPLA
ncbi:MAG TPA: GGDEF domain-containing protein [Terriglobales bacterium]|nr:GGDEF domain-containing protein [Terriglobales bacterium]